MPNEIANAPETLEYIRDLTKELAVMAKNAGFTGLHFVLELTATDAEKMRSHIVGENWPLGPGWRNPPWVYSLAGTMSFAQAGWPLWRVTSS